jgi:predicted membrane chloride channel (bestrophin family)
MASNDAKKITSIILTSVFFLAAALSHSWFPTTASPVVAATAFLTACFVHPVAYWLLGFDPVTREVREPFLPWNRHARKRET